MSGKKLLIRATKNQRGFTLVELLVGVALLIMVLAVCYSFYFFGYNSFSTGEARSLVRQNIRLAADYITQKIRYANQVHILESVPVEFDDGFDYIYVKDGVLMHKKDGDEETIVFDSISDGVILADLELNLIEQEQEHFLRYSIKNNLADEDNYSVDSKLKFLNQLTEYSGSIGIAIKYKSARPQEQHIFTVGIVGQGTTSPASGSYLFDQDTELTVIATPDSGWTFEKWIINGNDIADATTTVTIDSDMNATAYFLDGFYSFIQSDNVFVYGTEFLFSGNQVYGPDATIIVQGDLLTDHLNGGALNRVSNIYINGDIDIDGGSASLGSNTNPGSIYVNGNLTLWSGTRDIYGDIYVAGDLRLKDTRIHGNVYVAGNVELGWTPTIDDDARIFYTGSLNTPNNFPTSIINKCILVSEVPSVEMPDYPIPSLKPDTWYAENGYVSGGSLTDGIKIFTDNYETSDWRTYENVIIVSKGDITLDNWMHITGILFAPNGKVTFDGGSFEGVVIARDGFFVTSGGSTVTYKNINQFIDDVSDYPF